MLIESENEACYIFCAFFKIEHYALLYIQSWNIGEAAHNGVLHCLFTLCGIEIQPISSMYSVQIIVCVFAANYYRSPDKVNSLSVRIFPNTGSLIMVWARRFTVAFPPPTEVMVSLQGNCRRRPIYQKSSPTPRDNSFPLTTTLEILVLWLRGWIL